MKKVITASNNYDYKVAKELEDVSDRLAEILGNYSEYLSMEDKGVLSDEELEELGRAADMLHDASTILGVGSSKEW